MDSAGTAVVGVIIVGLFIGLVRLIAPKGQAEKWMVRIIGVVLMAGAILMLAFTAAQIWK